MRSWPSSKKEAASLLASSKEPSDEPLNVLGRLMTWILGLTVVGLMDAPSVESTLSPVVVGLAESAVCLSGVIMGSMAELVPTLLEVNTGVMFVPVLGPLSLLVSGTLASF